MARTIIYVFVLVVVGATCGASNLLVNGSFEQLNPESPFQALYWDMGLSILGWRTTDGGGPMPDGRIAAYCDPGGAGVTWMHNIVPIPVGDYFVTGWAKSYTSDSVKLHVSLANGNWSGDFLGDQQWHKIELRFTPTSDQLFYIGASGQGDDYILTDDWSVVPVPEPNGFVALGICLFLVGGGISPRLRRRR